MTLLLTNEDSARDYVRSNFAPSEQQWSALERYASYLTDENERQNLVAASTLPNLWVRHLADSAQLLSHAKTTLGAWIDLGSGAGLPGLVIAILREDPIILVESRKLRCNFLRDMVEALGLKNVTVEDMRLELLESFPAAVISARAFAPLEKLMNLANRFTQEETLWLLPKGRNAVNELEALPQAWQTMFHVEHSLTDVDSRILVGRGQIPAKRRGKA